MASVRCEKCGHVLSAEQDKCPNCGISIKTLFSKIGGFWANLKEDIDKGIQKAKANDINGKTEGKGNKSILIEAIRSDCSLNSVKSILKEGVDINLKDEQGCTALIFAASRKNRDIVKALVDAGADVNEKSSDGSSALINATKDGNFEVVRVLLRAEADPNATYKFGVSALMIASATKNKDLVRELIKYGADINAKNDLGETALMYAVLKDPESTEVLINAGADLNIKNNKGETALMYCSSRLGRDEMRKGLIMTEEDAFGLFGLTRFLPADIEKIMTYLFKSGADINAKNAKGETALMYAVRKGPVENIRRLGKAGADLNAKNNDGNTSLMISIMIRDYKKFITLLELGADPNIKSNDGNSALKLAKSKFIGKKPYIKALIDAGARE